MHHCPERSIGKSDALSRRVDHGMRGGDNYNLTLLHPEFFAAHAIHTLFGLLLEGDEQVMLQEIWSGNHFGRQEDTVAKAAAELRNQRGSPFECWSGQNVMDYSVSKTASMF